MGSLLLTFHHQSPNLVVLQSVVVLPSRAVAIENILRIYSPRLALVDAGLTRWLPKKWLTALPAEVPALIFKSCALNVNSSSCDCQLICVTTGLMKPNQFFQVNVGSALVYNQRRYYPGMETVVGAAYKSSCQDQILVAFCSRQTTSY